MTVSYSPVGSQNLLKLSDVIVLVGLDQVGHGQDLWVVLVWLGLEHRQTER